MSQSHRLSQALFHMLCVKDYRTPLDEESHGRQFNLGLTYADEFFEHRYAGQVDFKNKSVIDVGCGCGSACIYMAERGARRVVGIDIDEGRIEYARAMLAHNYPQLSARVEFRLPADGEAEQCDIVLSFNSFEHYADPEKFIWVMRRYMKPQGIMAIAFGPLWKSVWGGHIDYMTRFPWAHLLFPESVIMHERRRFRPSEQAECFAHIRGGLNKMTLQRYRRIVAESDLEFVLFETNVSRRKLIGVFNVLKRLPACEEYFTVDVCSIARQRPITASASATTNSPQPDAKR